MKKNKFKAALCFCTITALLLLTPMFIFGNDDATVLSTPSDIAQLMADSSSWDGSFILDSDIDMSEIPNQSPIGNSAVKFTGTFNGAGYTISGINITDSGPAGFFGVIENAAVLNLNLSGAVISTFENVSTTDNIAVGMLAGVVLSNSSIENCSVTGTVEGNGNEGGLIGKIYCSSGSVNVGDCLNYATITSPVGYTGGIVSSIDCTSTAEVGVNITGCVNYANISSFSQDDCRVGGICAFAKSSTGVVFETCKNEGVIIGTNSATSTSDAPFAAGIVGRIELLDSAGAYFSIIGSSNNSAISASYNAGGILGYSKGSASSTVESGIYKCKNTGTVTVNASSSTAKYSGGIVGGTDINLTVSECSNEGNILSQTTASKKVYAAGIIAYTNNKSELLGGTVINCANYASVSSASSNLKYAGGIIGMQFKYSLENCYNEGSVTATSSTYVGSISGCESGSLLCHDENCYAVLGTATKLIGTASDAYVTKTNVEFVDSDDKGLRGTYTDFDFYEIWIIKDGSPSLDTFTSSATGDIDGDGAVTQADLDLAVQHLSGYDILYRVNRFDLDNNGRINNRDMLLLRDIVLSN